MLPELAETRLPALDNTETLAQFINYSKERLDQVLEQAVANWWWRANLLEPVLHNFEAGEQVTIANLDTDTMSAMDVAWRTRKRAYLMNIVIKAEEKKVVLEFR
jgi:hypothetical protein